MLFDPFRATLTIYFGLGDSHLLSAEKLSLHNSCHSVLFDDKTYLNRIFKIVSLRSLLSFPLFFWCELGEDNIPR